jgi:hypothetical protein
MATATWMVFTLGFIVGAIPTYYITKLIYRKKAN